MTAVSRRGLQRIYCQLDCRTEWTPTGNLRVFNHAGEYVTTHAFDSGGYLLADLIVEAVYPWDEPLALKLGSALTAG